MESRRKIIFLIRKSPKSIGGVQRHSARLYDALSGYYDIEKICYKGPEWGVPAYFPLFYFKSMRNGAELLHCDDAVTSLIGAKIRKNSQKKVVATVHGLDVILPIPWYQRKLRDALANLDKVICVSRATADQVRARGISEEKIEIIPNVAERPKELPKKSEELFQTFHRQTGIDLRDKIVLFSLGRPLRRKGFDYFITDVFPYLPENCIYLVAGPAPKTPAWIKTVGPVLGENYHRLFLLASGCDTVHDKLKRLSSHPRIFYLNDFSDELRETSFALSDLFIMPNRTVEGDMEGFGIVALEAAARGIPVVATGIEGITDAVIDGQNGYCVPEGNAAAMVQIIKSFIDDPRKLTSFGEKAREFTNRNFSSEIVHGHYRRLFDQLFDDDRGNSFKETK